MNPIIHKPDSTREFSTPERCIILETWNDASDTAVSIARAKVEGNKNITTQLHRLRGIDERYLILSGKGIVKVGNLKPEEVGPGDVVVIPTGTSQQITNNEKSDLVFYCICSPRFTPDCYEALEE